MRPLELGDLIPRFFFYYERIATPGVGLQTSSTEDSVRLGVKLRGGASPQKASPHLVNTPLLRSLLLSDLLQPSLPFSLSPCSNNPYRLPRLLIQTYPHFPSAVL